MLDVFESNLIDNHLAAPDDGIVLGVSGGPDSMAMLDMFLKLREKWRLSLFVVHINHMFRGELAERDAKSVEAYCELHDIPFYRFDQDVEGLSKEWGMSFEEAGRKVRYQAFEKVRSTVGAQRIAVAQNKNDQAETILMRLMRGTGLDGLKGIPLKRGEYIVRPVLFMSRQEIELYCRENHVPVCYDHTNDETVYTRNKIRHELLPYIEDNFNGQVVDGLYRMGGMLAEDADFIEKSLDSALEKSGVNLERSDQISLDVVDSVHEALRSRLIRRIIKIHGNGLKDVSQSQVDEVLRLSKFRKHGKRKLISGIEFSIKYDTLSFRKLKEMKEQEVKKSIDESNMTVSELNMSEFEKYSLSRDEVSVDLDKLDGQLSVRFRADGDRFQPMGMNGSKKLKKFFIDLKIPSEERDSIPLVCDESGIIWIVGLRLSERVKVDEKTLRVGIIKWSDSC